MKLKFPLKNAAAAAALLAVSAATAPAMQIIVDMNTLPLNQYGTLGALHGAGCWLVFNHNPSTTQVQQTIDNLGTGIVVAENIYPGLYNYNLATSAGRRPTAAFSYHETGGTPGGTVLTNAEINSIKSSIGSSSVVVLTRGYTDSRWSGPVNTALANPNCSGVTFEIAPYYTNGNNDDIKTCIDHCVSVGKNCYLLFANTESSGGNYYQQLQGEFQSLLERGTKLYDSHVILAIGNYAAQSAPWLGSEGDNSVQGAQIWSNAQNKYMHQYYFQNQNSMLFLDVAGGSTSAGAAVQQNALSSASSQRWFALYDTGGNYSIRNLNSKLPMDVVGASKSAGALVQQYTSNGKANQLWQIAANGAYYSFISKNSGMALDNNGATAAGTQLIQNTSTAGDASQLWNFYPETAANAPLTLEAELLTVAATSPGITERIVADPGFSGGAGTILDATAVGNAVTFVVPNVTAGSYNLRVGVKNYNTRGIWQLAIGRADNFAGTANNVGGPNDGYAATATFTEIDLGTWTPGTTSDKWFQFMITGKNASSTGFTESFDYIKLIPN